MPSPRPDIGDWVEYRASPNSTCVSKYMDGAVGMIIGFATPRGNNIVHTVVNWATVPEGADVPPMCEPTNLRRLNRRDDDKST
jgi:hypothetical protein